jgi:hypothetical protein
VQARHQVWVVDRKQEGPAWESCQKHARIIVNEINSDSDASESEFRTPLGVTTVRLGD